MVRADWERSGGRGRWIRGLGLAGLLLWIPGIGEADWFDDFDAGFAETWIFGAYDDAGNPPATGTSTFEIVEAGADDYLRISHSTTALPDGGGGATDGFGYVDEVFGDVAVSADINVGPLDGPQNLLGVLARGDGVTGTAYIAAVDFAHSLFAIARSTDPSDFILPLAIDPLVSLDADASYRIEFFVVGSTLTALLIESASGQVISGLSATDTLYTSGVSGVLVETEYDGNDVPVGPIIGSFDNVEAVPEPGATLALVAGIGGLAGLGRRRAHSDGTS